MNIAEKRLRDYPNYDYQIKLRKWDLEYTETDLNAGIKSVGKISNAIEQKYIRWESDPYIANRLFWKKCIDETLNELDSKQKEIVTEYYFEDVYSYRDLADKYHTNRNTIMKACNRARDILSTKLGETFK